MGDEVNYPHGVCQRVGCVEPATLYPVLVLKPRGYKGQPVRACLKLPVCKECAAKAKDNADTYLGDAAWTKILEGFDQMKRMRPHRGSTKIEHVGIDDPEWQKFWAAFEVN
jgi:hypothetical protein